MTILIGISGVMAVTPLISIEMTTMAIGSVSTSGANFILQSPVSGTLVSYQLSEGQQVYQGDSLVKLDTRIFDQEIIQLDSRLTELDTYITEVEWLINDANTDSLSTAAYLLSQQQYQSGLERLTVKQRSAFKTYKRQQLLYRDEVIPAIELQKDRDLYDLAKAETVFFTKQALNTWKHETLGFEQEYKQLLLKKEQLKNELLKYVLIAPSSGTLQQVVSLSAGQQVQVGMKFGEVSVDTTLLAVCWISPRDIGLIQNQMTATFRIDAFNVNDWGFIHGQVTSVSSDAYIMNNLPYFKVECSLRQDHLTLKNGFVGKLKKGMTLQANFKVATRTLYQLLYDKMEDWLNPKIASE
jgi:HlyD family secretion protein